MIWNTACDRDEWLLANVTPDVRTALPCWISFITSSTVVTSASLMPTIWTCCFPSSSTRSFSLLLSRSNTWFSSQRHVSDRLSLTSIVIGFTARRTHFSIWGREGRRKRERGREEGRKGGERGREAGRKKGNKEAPSLSICTLDCKQSVQYSDDSVMDSDSVHIHCRHWD